VQRITKECQYLPFPYLGKPEKKKTCRPLWLAYFGHILPTMEGQDWRLDLLLFMIVGGDAMKLGGWHLSAR
jgi:hypothetical protein